MSVSRLAGLPHLGQITLRNSSFVANGLPLSSQLNLMSKGNLTGKSDLVTGTTPQLSQCIIGIGVPQNL